MRTADSGPVYLDKPGYREKLQPSKRRNLLSPPLLLSNDLVLQHRKEVANEAVYADAYDDGLDARLLRLGAGMSVKAPDPLLAGGLYLFVVNGSLEWLGAMLPLWSMVAIETGEAPFSITAGAQGLEVRAAVRLQFAVSAFWSGGLIGAHADGAYDLAVLFQFTGNLRAEFSRCAAAGLCGAGGKASFYIDRFE